MTVFDIVEKQEKSGFLPSGFLQKLSLQNQKSSDNQFGKTGCKRGEGYSLKKF